MLVLSSLNLLPELMIMAQLQALELVVQLEVASIRIILILGNQGIHLKKLLEVPLLLCSRLLRNFIWLNQRLSDYIILLSF